MRRVSNCIHDYFPCYGFKFFLFNRNENIYVQCITYTYSTILYTRIYIFIIYTSYSDF